MHYRTPAAGFTRHGSGSLVAGTDGHAAGYHAHLLLPSCNCGTYDHSLQKLHFSLTAGRLLHKIQTVLHMPGGSFRVPQSEWSVKASSLLLLAALLGVSLLPSSRIWKLHKGNTAQQGSQWQARLREDPVMRNNLTIKCHMASPLMSVTLADGAQATTYGACCCYVWNVLY